MQFSLMCIALTCGVQGGVQPRCRTVYETECETTYETDYDISYEEVCKDVNDTVYEERCTKTYEEVCPGFVHFMADFFGSKNCQPVAKPSCTQVPVREVLRFECEPVARQNVIQVPVETCKEVPKQSC